MNAVNGEARKVVRHLKDSQKWVLANYLSLNREKLISENVSLAKIAETMQPQLGVLPTAANVENCMKSIGMWRDYVKASRRHGRQRADARPHSTRVRDRRVRALYAAVKKIAAEYEIDISAEIGDSFDVPVLPAGEIK